MFLRTHHTTHTTDSVSAGHRCCVAGRFLLLLCCLTVTAVGALRAQSGEWAYDSINTSISSDLLPALSPRAVIDRWGVVHHVWVSRDPNSAGLQVYQADDQSGEFGAPFLMTDTGTIYDTVGTDSTSYRFAVDQEGVLHLAFLANVFGPNGLQIGLYYTNDRVGTFQDFPPVLLTNRSGRYDMAIDSSGVAHILWLRELGGEIELHYWNDRIRTSRVIGSVPCSGPNCRLSDPEMEIHVDRLEVFVQNDSGSLRHLTFNMDGLPLGTEDIAVPRYDPTVASPKARDLRMRGVLDSSGRYHLLISRNDKIPSSLFYLTNAEGNFSISPVISYDSILLDFDIAADGRGRMAAAWTTFRGRFAADRPRTGFAGYARDEGGAWRQTEFVDDLNSTAGNPDGEWRIVNDLAISGERAFILGERFVRKNDSSIAKTGMFYRSARTPQTSYMLPDAAAPGMSVVVETYAPAHAFGAFGPDTLDPAEVGLELVRPEDADRLVVGPSVVSWEGRLLSTMLFVHPDATPGDVPLRVRVGENVSNEQIFSIVLPQRLGANGSGLIEGGGRLGSGGIYGTRSRRGVLVVDTLILRHGVYTAEMTDIDPQTEGEQGFLPLTILAAGEVIVDSTAVLSVSAPNAAGLSFPSYGLAGPGGGGGGGGNSTGGGTGYTAGGAPSDTLIAKGNGARPASGGDRSGRFGAGGSMNDVPGGSARLRLPSGGGTGHPFGSSGRYGRSGEEFPLKEDPGGHGGGTGGAIMGFVAGDTALISGGGGGGHALAGEHGGVLVHNGGRAVGSSVLVPLAGGGGGGGAHSLRGRVSGGGGGGAFSLYSRRAIYLLGEIRADGADGVSDATSSRGSGGGGGAGGGVLMGAQGGLVVGRKGKVSVTGGRGGVSVGPGTENGGDGGSGRIRVDGRIDYVDSAMTVERLMPGYLGPASNMNGIFQAESGTVVSGVAVPGRTIRIFLRPQNGEWSYDKPRDVIADTNGFWSLSLDATEVADGLLYVAVLERTEEPSNDRWRAVPKWIMSTAGGAIVGQPGIRINRSAIDFGCVNYPECKTDTIFITNTGTQSDLVIRQVEMEGATAWFSLGESGQLRIPPGHTGILRVRFCPQREGDTTALLRLITNVRPDSVRVISLAGCGITGKLSSQENEIDLGDLCPGSCLDTVVTLRNHGNAPLDVTGVAPIDKNLDVTILSPALPFRIDPGKERTVRVRACLQGDGGNFVVSFRATTPPPSHAIIFRVRNIGPEVSLPSSVNFDPRDIGADDTCRTEQFTLRNRSSLRPLEITSLDIDLPWFEVLSPTVGTTIPPDGEVQVLVRFCGGDTAGNYERLLRIGLAGGSCTLDTSLQLRGSIIRSVPSLDLNVLDKVDFGSVQVGARSIPREIRIVNQGEGTARNVTWQLTAISPTGSGEIDLVGSAGPFTIKGGAFEAISVTMSPGALGLRQGILYFASEDGWRDTVLLCVTGVEPGITADTFYLDFGGVRVGNTADRTLRFYNRGSISDKLTTIELVDSTIFTLVNLSDQLPVDLQPLTDNLLARFKFSPAVAGQVWDTVRAGTGSGRELIVLLTGTGLLEKAETDVATVSFVCPEGARGVDSVVVTNAGTWQLIVSELQLGGANPGAFRLLDLPAPDVIDPGKSKTYRIEYLPTTDPVRATLRIVHSGRGTTLIELEGSGCEPEEFFLTFVLPDVTGSVGSVVSIPLQLQTDAPLPDDVPFRVVVAYDPTLLMPAKGDALRPVEARNVKGGESLPGELVLEGLVPSGTGTGVLLEVPMQVLLGRTYRTDLEIRFEGEDLPSHYRPFFENGTFTALDCDTTGTIDLGGAYVIKQSVPNPVAAEVRIDFEIARRERVEIFLYDATGTTIATLLDRTLDRGEHRLLFDASTLSAGLYYYEIRSGRYREVRRMIVVD